LLSYLHNNDFGLTSWQASVGFKRHSHLWCKFFQWYGGSINTDCHHEVFLLLTAMGIKFFCHKHYPFNKEGYKYEIIYLVLVHPGILLKIWFACSHTIAGKSTFCHACNILRHRYTDMRELAFKILGCTNFYHPVQLWTNPRKKNITLWSHTSMLPDNFRTHNTCFLNMEACV
jgi:hypothetical protein